MTYNNYSELTAETNSILGTTVTYLRDSFGRDAGIQATRGGVMFYDASYACDTATGLVNSAVFNTSATFAFTYVPGTDCEVTLASPVYVKTNTWLTAIARPSEIRYNCPGTSGALLSKRNYAFDLLSRVTSASRTNDDTTFVNDTFAYNTRSELASAFMNGTSFSYAFDDIGNRSSAVEQNSQIETYTANACNQYIESRHGEEDGDVITEFAYDDDGNTTQCGASQFEYDAENRPTHFTGEDDKEAFYAHDAYGRRTWKRVLMGEFGTDTALRFLYAGNLQIAEFDANPITGAVTNLRNSFFWAPTALVATKVLVSIDYQISSTPLLRYMLHDAMKNAVNAITPDGTLSSEICYSPFGMPSDTLLAAEFRFAFSGEYFDAETDTIHYLFCDLNHKTGRWPTHDPIGEKGGWNLYAFCGNNGINAWDKFGYVKQLSISVIPESDKFDPALSIAKIISGSSKIIIRDFPDMLKKMKNYLKSCKNDCPCFKYITIYSHSPGESVYFSTDFIKVIEEKSKYQLFYYNLDEIKGIKYDINKLLLSLKSMLCEISTIEFYQCESGVGNGKILGQLLSNTLSEYNKKFVKIILYKEKKRPSTRLLFGTLNSLSFYPKGNL